jgi:hypothetical protein
MLPSYYILNKRGNKGSQIGHTKKKIVSITCDHIKQLTLLYIDYFLMFTFFQMLTEEQRKMLARSASEKYWLDINSTQISHLILDYFECNFYFGDEHNFIKGEVENFRKFPLRMDFDVPVGSKERDVLEMFLHQGNKQTQLKFSCKLASESHTIQIKTLTISSNNFQHLGIKEKLLGSAASAYVNMAQLYKLAGLLYSSLNILEEYEMSENQFQKYFVHDFLGLATDQNFHHVPARQALMEQSSYGLQTGQELLTGNFFNCLK